MSVHPRHCSICQKTVLAGHSCEPTEPKQAMPVEVPPREKCSTCGAFVESPWCAACGAFDGGCEDAKCHHGFSFRDSCISANCDAVNHGPDKKRYLFKPSEKWSKK